MKATFTTNELGDLLDILKTAKEQEDEKLLRAFCTMMFEINDEDAQASADDMQNRQQGRIDARIMPLIDKIETINDGLASGETAKMFTADALSLFGDEE